MVASISGSGSGVVAQRAGTVASRLDTGKQDDIDKAGLTSADTGTVDGMSSAIVGDSDGKVAKSDLTQARTKVADQLDAQFDAARVQGGMPPGPPPGGTSSDGASDDGAVDAAGATGGAEETDSTDSTDYVAAADTDGDGTVSDAEQAAYDKKLASGEIDKNGNETGEAGGGTESARRQDPARELAHALHLLKAYAENGADSDAAAASTGSVSVAA
jgi:hypothetical protein